MGTAAQEHEIEQLHDVLDEQRGEIQHLTEVLDTLTGPQHPAAATHPQHPGATHSQHPGPGWGDPRARSQHQGHRGEYVEDRDYPQVGKSLIHILCYIWEVYNKLFI